MKGYFRIIAAVFVVAFLSGCTVRMADFMLASTKSTAVQAKAIGKRVSGENCAFAIWFAHFSEPSIKEAFDRSLEAAGPDFDTLGDVVIYEKMGVFSNCVKVQGVALNTKISPASASSSAANNTVKKP